MKNGAFARFWALCAGILLTAGLIGCGGDGDGGEGDGKKVTVKVEPYKGPGIDSSVTAENGGVGFDEIAEAQGWQTRTIDEAEYFTHYASRDAKKGGELTYPEQDFPAVLRPYGKDANTVSIQNIEQLCYESLTALDPLTLEFVPRLATHWKISEDGQTYFYRINPNARFSDGYPVTSKDVLATFKLITDKGILDPFLNEYYGSKLDVPVAVSPYIVSVRSKEKNWKNMMYFGGIAILPAHYLDQMDGAGFIEYFKFEIPPGSGPYVLKEENVAKGKSYSLTRRDDWWRKDDPMMQGRFNFDKITFKTIADPAAQIQEFLAGNLDLITENRAQWWKEKYSDEGNNDIFKRGIAQKRKVFNDNPQGLQGWAYNTRKAPFNDPKVREAFTLLIPREQLIEKIMYNEYIISDSYFPGSPYENKNNKKYRYNPKRAVELLKEAGYTKRNAQGILVHEQSGKPFSFEIPLVAGSEHIMQPVQQELKKAGIEMTIRTVDFAQRIKIGNERKFDVLYVSYAGLVFPNPFSMLHSSMADKQETTNLTGFKNKTVDSLIDAELLTYDQAERIRQMQTLDSIFMSENHYALAWSAPFTRVIFWSYIAHPDFYLTRFGDYRDIFEYWWYDSSKVDQVTKGRRDKTVTIETPDSEVDVMYWPNFKKSAGTSTATASN